MEGDFALDREALMQNFTQLNRMKQDLLKKISKNEKKLNSALQEMKNYIKPPVVIVRVFVSLFILLQVDGFEEYLGPSLSKFPADPHKLWKFAKSHIQLSQMHPKNLIRMLKDASKAHSEIGSTSPQHKEFLMKAALMLMDPVTTEDVKRASEVAVMLLQWIKVGMKQVQTEIELLKLETKIKRMTNRNAFKAVGLVGRMM
ncbi:hypothetical protein CYMTET_10506 [Cymbomonas tetramitiformis]|uniref:Uncharacterized protein n=1 Tax=Cymbomonas tetramitiformis TaxID=36881 RepID=A0AAE0GP50_9CHLO|nr:hypothetical protein CYMTET_10506 [Cymbomonas tetramitiformis]